MWAFCVNARIISAAQNVEYYEIATYGTLCSFVKILREKGPFIIGKKH